MKAPRCELDDAVDVKSADALLDGPLVAAGTAGWAAALGDGDELDMVENEGAASSARPGFAWWWR